MIGSKRHLTAPIAATIDSNRCAVAYVVRSPRDVPANVQVPEADQTFQIGLFLPRQLPDWLGRSSHAARVVLLSAGRLVILMPSDREVSVRRIELRDLLFFEIGHTTRRGWLRFIEKGVEHQLPYQGDCKPVVDEFLRGFREAYLPSRSFSNCTPCVFGELPQSKFLNAKSFELLAGEQVLFQFFSPATKHITVRWILPWESWTANDLLAVTSRRILWITDRVEGRYDFYAVVIRSAPIETLSEVSVEPANESLLLSIKFLNGARWSVSLPMGWQADTFRFAEAIALFKGISGFRKGL